MKIATATDRALVSGTAGVLVLWSACLLVLWGRAIDCSGSSTIIALTGSMLAMSAAIMLPSSAARGVQRILIWLNLQDVLRMELDSASPAPLQAKDAKKFSIFFAWVLIVAAACGLLSTLAVYAFKPVLAAVGQRLAMSWLGWGVTKLIAVFVGMFPLAIGAAITFLAGALFRGGFSKEISPGIFRDWLVGAAAAMLLLGIIWRFNADLLAASGACAAILIGCGAGVFLSKHRPTSSRRSQELVDPRPTGRLAASVVMFFAGLSFACMIQNRLLADAWGIGVPWRLVLMGLSLAMLTYFVRQADAGPRVDHDQQVGGAITGLAVGLMIQLTLGFAGMGAQRSLTAVLCAICAMAAQIPVAAFAGANLSRQRRTIPMGRFWLRRYCSLACIGVAVGMLAYLTVMSMARAKLMLVVLGLVWLAVGLIVGISASSRAKLQLQWACWSGVLMCSLTAVVVIAIRQTQAHLGDVHMGTWLSSRLLVEDKFLTWDGFLSDPDRWRSDNIDRIARGVMSARKGRWSAVISSSRDVIGQSPSGVFWSLAVADPSAMPAWTAQRWAFDRGWGSYYAPPQPSDERFDGVLIAPLPADHVHAWRCYNDQAMLWCGSAVHPAGTFMLRTQVRAGNLGAALSVARTFHEVFGPGWLLIDQRDGDIDMLLVSPVNHFNATALGGNPSISAFLTEDIERRWPGIDSVRLQTPGTLGLHSDVELPRGMLQSGK